MSKIELIATIIIIISILVNSINTHYFLNNKSSKDTFVNINLMTMWCIRLSVGYCFLPKIIDYYIK